VHSNLPAFVPNRRLSNFGCYFCFVIVLLFTIGCAGVQSISEEAVQEKLTQIKLGLTTKEEIENLFGKNHSTDQYSWSYNLSDSAMAVSQSTRSGWSGLFPLTFATVPTNTRALITVTFKDSQTVTSLKIERFFNAPFINDYFYFFDRDAALESAARTGETSHFRIGGFDKSAGKFVLEDDANNGQIVVEFNKPILHVTSINPYDRLSNEYRVFIKRETQFIDKIFASTNEAVILSGP
jgi:hypothetical protein